MGKLINIVNLMFEPLFIPFAGMRPDYALFIITSVTGVAMLYLYKWTSDQTKLKAVRQRLKAHILEIQLYRTDLRIMLRSLYRVFAKNLTYMWLLLPPAILLIALVVLVVVQCYPRFQYRPVAPGEKVLVKAVLREWPSGSSDAVNLSVPDGVRLDSAPLAIPSLREVDWRVVPSGAGTHELVFTAGGEKLERTLVSGVGIEGVSPVRSAFSLAGYIENPLELPVSQGSAFESVVVMYPERDMGLPLMFGMNWIVYFFVVSFLVALGWKFVARVH